MKELGKCRAVIALLWFTATVFSGCGNRTEAVITDGEDITPVTAEYPTLEESHADIFTYKDLKIGNISYLMTESQVIAILGKPKEETENDGEKIYSYNEMSIGFEKLDDNNRPSGSGVYTLFVEPILSVVFSLTVNPLVSYLEKILLSLNVAVVLPAAYLSESSLYV